MCSRACVDVLVIPGDGSKQLYMASAACGLSGAAARRPADDELEVERELDQAVRLDALKSSVLKLLESAAASGGGGGGISISSSGLAHVSSSGWDLAPGMISLEAFYIPYRAAAAAGLRPNKQLGGSVLGPVVVAAVVCAATQVPRGGCMLCALDMPGCAKLEQQGLLEQLLRQVQGMCCQPEKAVGCVV